MGRGGAWVLAKRFQAPPIRPLVSRRRRRTQSWSTRQLRKPKWGKTFQGDVDSSICWKFLPIFCFLLLRHQNNHRKRSIYCKLLKPTRVKLSENIFEQHKFLVNFSLCIKVYAAES